MEMPEQELPAVFSHMLQMFPNIPQEIVWLYVQRYSRDIEKCAQMLNLQNSKYDGLKSTLNTGKNLNECNSVLRAPYFMFQSETALDNNNDVPFSEQLPLLNSDCGVIRKCTNDKPQTEEITYNISSESFKNIMHRNDPLDSSRNLRKETKFINFNEPLVLDIVPDDDDILHSWRPNVSADVLCSDLFVPSSTSEDFQLNSNLVPSLNFEPNNKIIMNLEGMSQDPWKCSNSSLHMLHGYTEQNGMQYEKDIASYLHYQKSQMNVIWYEVIKAKIEQSDLKETVEKLQFELKEKMQSKSVQDIEELNEEIVQLRLECQCLCTEVDQVLNDQGLLGEVDEKCYKKNNSSSNNEGDDNVASGSCTNPHPEINTDEVHDDSNRWQCSKCTFANHSAINVCEMCSAPKPQRPAYLQAAPSSCYCHPKEKSLSIQS